MTDPPDTVTLFQQLAISLLLGGLVGLQRERTEAEMAGFRTFPLITVLGTLCAILARHYGFDWLVAVGFAATLGVIIVGNLPKLRDEEAGRGVTTEFAMLIMYAVGAFLVVGPWLVAVAVAGGVAILLQLKPQLHGLAARMGDKDMRAIMQFVLITFIVLPILQEYNQDYDPFVPLHEAFPRLAGAELAVLNPYEIWLMVVLVVSISLGAYVLYKLVGERAGVLLGGILGGTISSTATTVSYSRRTAESGEAARLAALAVMIASSITFVRVLVEIAVAAPSFLPDAAGPLLIMFAVSVVLSLFSWIAFGSSGERMPEQENPTELKSALIFGVLYAVVIVAVALGEEFFKDWIYVVAVLSGMTDMDAITLATARSVNSGRLTAETGWRLVVVGTMSNMVFKAGIVAFLGHRALLGRVALLFGVALAAGGVVLAVW